MTSGGLRRAGAGGPAAAKVARTARRVRAAPARVDRPAAARAPRAAARVDRPAAARVAAAPPARTAARAAAPAAAGQQMGRQVKGGPMRAPAAPVAMVKPLPPGVQGHPNPTVDYPEYPGFTLALVEEFDQPLDLDKRSHLDLVRRRPARGSGPLLQGRHHASPSGKMLITVRRQNAPGSNSYAEPVPERRRRLRPGQAPAQRRDAHQVQQLPLRPLRGAA